MIAEVRQRVRQRVRQSYASTTPAVRQRCASRAASALDGAIAPGSSTTGRREAGHTTVFLRADVVSRALWTIRSPGVTVAMPIGKVEPAPGQFTGQVPVGSICRDGPGRSKIRHWPEPRTDSGKTTRRDLGVRPGARTDDFRSPADWGGRKVTARRFTMDQCPDRTRFRPTR